MAKRRRKTRTHLKGPNNSAASSTTAPKSFVIRSGKVGRSVGGLVQDVRKVLEPNTAIRLRERKSNKLRDFVSMSGPLGVSHMVIFNQTDAGINMRVARCPRGPTCTFRVNKFALMNDVLRSQKRPRAPGGEFGTPPLLVLNNFGGEARHLKLLVTVFQNLFPPIQVQTMHLSQARRVVLLSYNAQTETIEWRHYIISVRPVGVSRSVRRVIEGTNRPGPSSTGAPMKRKGKGLPNLGNVGDISEYVLGRATRSGSVGAASDTDVSEAESELEDMNDPANAIELSERYVGRGNDANEQRAVRLREIGPRIELKLIKIEDGMVGGETLYHDRVKKTAKEATALKQAVAAKKKLKQERKAEQAANVARKEEEKAARKTKGKEQAAEGAEADEEGDDDDDLPADGEDSDADEDDDDFEYEDRFADSVPQDAQEERANLFDEDDDLGADDDDISLSEGDGEDEDDGDSFDEEDDDEEEEPFDYEDDGINHDDSDLDPIPVGRGLMAYDSDSDDAVGPAPALSKSNGAKSTLKKRKVDVGKARGKGKARR